MTSSLPLVLNTTRASIGVQLLTGILGFYGLSLSVPKESAILKEILTLEMVVQSVEFIFYIVLVVIAHIQTMTLFRYGDWFLSTPTMLFTMASYFLYSSPSPPNSIEDVWNSHRAEIIAIAVANFGMLAFGFAGELGFIPKGAGFTLGTLCFLIAFRILYSKFAETSKMKPLYFIMTGVWSLYGVAYLQGNATKNIAYNFLDILAKNFFGLYLSYQIWVQHSKGNT